MENILLLKQLLEKNMKMKVIYAVSLFAICVVLDAAHAQAACTPEGGECDSLPHTYCNTQSSSCICIQKYEVNKQRTKCVGTDGQPCNKGDDCSSELCATHSDGTKKCSTKLGTPCTENGRECASIEHSKCDTKLGCVCNSTFTASQDMLLCKSRPGQPCSKNAECITELCTMQEGVMKCNESSRISSSYMVIVATFLVSRLLQLRK